MNMDNNSSQPFTGVLLNYRDKVASIVVML